MFCLNDTMRYFLCPGKTNMRKGMHSLCGIVRDRMGYDVRFGDVFIFINRSRLYVKVIIRPKYGLRDNTALPDEGKSSVLIAALPLLPIYKGLPGSSMLTEILLQKYEYHAPFYRQVQVFRHLGLRIPENTLNGWFKPACELLAPLYEELKNEVLSIDYILYAYNRLFEGQHAVD